ncbi:8755_t:CDS:2 [Paraglomus brasilianum]|uniref:8755_t:CDS:1 n=1 Tax=Paraglomus brasilianum TaxID=144538 RepID=A0A9N8VUQ5_9GLOM|nr:8755_t:CDS:2 [Paraglomus brasilianum]
MKRKPKRRLSTTDSHASSSTSTYTHPISSNISSSSLPLHKRFRRHATRGTPVHAPFVSDPACIDHSDAFDDNDDDTEVYRKHRNSMNDTVSVSCGSEKENKENKERMDCKECREKEDNTKDLDKESCKANVVGKEREKDRDKERVKEKGKDAKIRGRDREREATQDRSEHASMLRAAQEEILELKKEIKRLQAEVSFKDQVIESLHAQSKKPKPGLTCVICVEYMSNPCTISCGHTFCYECLYDWLKIRRECPTCRKKISQRPTLSFVVKEQVETYVEQLAPDERESAKARLRDKEASLKEQSDPWSEVFGGHTVAVIVDDADGVSIEVLDERIWRDRSQINNPVEEYSFEEKTSFHKYDVQGALGKASFSVTGLVIGNVCVHCGVDYRERTYRLDESDHDLGLDSDEFDDDDDDDSDGHLLYFYERNSFSGGRDIDSYSENDSIPDILSARESDPYETDSTDRSYTNSDTHSFIQQQLRTLWTQESQIEPIYVNTSSQSSNRGHRRVPLATSTRNSSRRQDNEDTPRGSESSDGYHPSSNYSIVSDDTSDAPRTHLALSQGTQYRLRSPILAATIRGSPGSSHDDIHSDSLISDDADDDTSSSSSDDDISYESGRHSLSTLVSDDAEDFDIRRQLRSIGAGQVRPYVSGENYTSATRSGESYTSATRSGDRRRWMARG